MSANPFRQAPWLGGAVVCLALTVIWLVVWPANEAGEVGSLRYLLIRWGHALTWALLTIMCLLKASQRPSLDRWSSIVGLSALGVYLAFLVTSFVRP